MLILVFFFLNYFPLYANISGLKKFMVKILAVNIIVADPDPKDPGSEGSASFCRIRIHNIFQGSGYGSRSEPSPPPLLHHT